MNKLLYSRLAAQNMVKNAKFYLPYLLAIIGTTASYYIVTSLSSDPSMVNIPRGGVYLQSMMWLGTGIITLFVAIFLFYTNSFLIKRRKKELGLYNILGMEKRHIAAILAYESLYTAFIGIGGGLLCGIGLYKLVVLILGKILRFDVVFGFSVSTSGLQITVIVFSLLLLLLLISNLLQIRHVKPVELMRGGNMGEREPKTRWVLTLLGILTLGGGYWIAMTTRNALETFAYYFLAVFLVVIGTYCLFTSVSIAALKLMRKSKRFYYRPNHFISVSGMLYRMKQNAVGLANICILSTMVLVTVSTTVCLYLGLGSTLDNMYPHDIQITQRQKNILTDAAPEALLAQAESAAAGEGRTLRHESYIIHSRVYWTLSGDTFRFGDQQEGVEYTVSLMTAAEYSRLTGRAVSLAPDEMLVYTSEGTVPETFRIESTPYRVAGTLDTFQGESRAMISNVPNAGFVVADDSVLSAIYAQSGGNFTTYLDLYLDCDGTDAEKIAFYDVLNDTLGKADDIYMDSRQLSAIDFYSMYGGFLFLGMFLGILFLAATALIIYYKQVSEGYEDRKRFEIMQQVGMSRREVRETINSQVRMVFFLPLAVAALHILMAFSMIRKLLLLFSLTDVGLFALCTVGTLLIFSAIYALVYSFTAKAYYKIVRST